MTNNQVNEAVTGLQRHASTAAARASIALMAQHRKIDELEMCIEANLEDIPAPGVDVFCCGCNTCNENESVEQGKSTRDLAEKIYALGWVVTNIHLFTVECPKCASWDAPESDYARQLQSDSGGTFE